MAALFSKRLLADAVETVDAKFPEIWLRLAAGDRNLIAFVLNNGGLLLVLELIPNMQEDVGELRRDLVFN